MYLLSFRSASVASEPGFHNHDREDGFRVRANSASIRAFTPVFDGLWTRATALMLAPRNDGGDNDAP